MAIESSGYDTQDLPAGVVRASGYDTRNWELPRAGVEGRTSPSAGAVYARRVPKRFTGLPTPTELADRLGVSVSAVVFGVLAVIAAAAAGWWALRTPAGPDPEKILPAVGAVSIPLPTPESSLPAAIVVHVVGAVVFPGVHELPLGSRVVDAIIAAGGLADSADESRLNLAAPVSDGIRLWVPSVGETDEPVVAPIMPAGTDSGSALSSNATGGAKVNVNTADTAVLQTLPGIGPSLAAAIVEHRERAGPFLRIEDLEQVAGIGPAKLERIRLLVEV